MRELDHQDVSYAKLKELLQIVAHAFFTSTPDSGFHRELVQKAISHDNTAVERKVLPDKVGEALAQRLDETQERLLGLNQVLEDASSLSERLQNKVGNLAAGEVGINYDPYMQGNTPYRLFSLPVQDQNNNQRVVSCIRMGTPTCQLTPVSPEITLEFRTFVESLKPEKSHLYINRQKRSGVEGERSRVLEKSQQETGLTGKLTIVTLPADGDLYNQKGVFAADRSFEQLKSDLVAGMIDNLEGFYFPPSIKEKMPEKNLKKYLERLFESIRDEVGVEDSGKKLSGERRRAIIFHFLNKTLVESLLEVTGATTYNNTCKDDIDRGGMANAYMYAVTRQNDLDPDNKEKMEQCMVDLEGVAFAPAMIVKKRAVIPHRFHDLMNALRNLPSFWDRMREEETSV